MILKGRGFLTYCKQENSIVLGGWQICQCRTEVYSQREGSHVLVLHLLHLVLSIIDKQGLLKTVNQTKGWPG